MERTREDSSMSMRDWWNQDSLIWGFVMSDSGPEVYESPGMEAPEAWVSALEAVARDLRCLRYGREVHPDRLVWQLVIDSDYAVTIGWEKSSGIGGFCRFEAMSMDASFGEAAVWVADTVQTNLAGYEFMQWPSQGHFMLVPCLRDGIPLWVDPHTDGATAAIGRLCEHLTCA